MSVEKQTTFSSWCQKRKAEGQSLSIGRIWCTFVGLKVGRVSNDEEWGCCLGAKRGP